jgi:Tol biopolymer transport system component
METGINEGAWSADGNIFFNRYTRYERGIYRYDLRSKNRQVIFVPTPAMDLVQEVLALSPDGRTVAFQARSRPGRQTSTLMLVPAAGGDARSLWTVAAPDTFGYGAFAWLPDSSALLVSRTRGYQGVSELWLVPVSGMPPRRIDFPFSGYIAGLRLNADGQTIAFHSGEGEKSELRVLENFLPAR